MSVHAKQTKYGVFLQTRTVVGASQSVKGEVLLHSEDSGKGIGEEATLIKPKARRESSIKGKRGSKNLSKLLGKNQSSRRGSVRVGRSNSFTQKPEAPESPLTSQASVVSSDLMPREGWTPKAPHEKTTPHDSVEAHNRHVYHESAASLRLGTAR